jgi:hypothetical protein
MKCLGLNNKPTAEVHPGHMLTGPKEEEEEEELHPIARFLRPCDETLVFHISKSVYKADKYVDHFYLEYTEWTVRYGIATHFA